MSKLNTILSLLLDLQSDNELEEMAQLLVDPADLKKAQLKITGMTCSSCVANIEKSLSKKKGELISLLQTHKHRSKNQLKELFINLFI